MNSKGPSLFCFTVIFVASIAAERLVELNRDYSNENTRTWPGLGYKPYRHTAITRGHNEKGLWYEAYNFETAEHSGTHVDSPSHFYEYGWTLDEIPLEHFFAPAVVMDIREKVEKDPLAFLSAHDVVNWVDKHGSLPNNSIVLVRTGWATRNYDDPQAYFGIQGDKKVFPGIGISAAQTLLGYRALSDIHIVGVGIDGPSIDVGNSVDAETHRELARVNIYNLEGLHNLEELPATGAELIVMPMKIKGGSGAPSRVIARIRDSGSGIQHCSLTIIVAAVAFLMGSS